MRKSGLSIVIGAVVAAVWGQSGMALAQPSEPTAREPGAPRPPEGTAASPARRRLSDSGELERVVSLYAGGKYEDCAREVAALLDPKNEQRLTNPGVVEEARLYHATCLVMSGREKEAIAPLRAALTQNPTMGTPDSLTFPPPLIRLFLQVRKEFADAIQAEEARQLRELAKAAAAAKAEEEAERRRVRELEKMAATETVIQQHSRFVASLPFGVGQFQNGSNALGTVFLVSEVALLGASLGAVAVANYQYTLVHPRAYGSDITRNIRTARTVAIIGFYGFLAVAVGGITEAHVNFVPSERKERWRELPVRLRAPRQTPAATSRVVPWLAPERGGAMLGLGGVF